MKLLFFSLYLMSVALLPLESYGQNQNSNPVDITFNRGDIILKGKFYESERETTIATVLLLQGFPGNETDVIGLCRRLSQYGINAMTFNYSGTHQSQGKLSFDNSLKDVTAAWSYLHESGNIDKFSIDTSLIILAGYSYGGGIAMTYAMRHPEIKSVITIAGNDWGQYFEDYIQNQEMKKTTDANIAKSIASGVARFEVGATPWELAEKGLDKINPDLYVTRNASLLADREILIIAGWDDTGPTVERYILPLYRALRSENAKQVQIAAFQDDHSFGKSREELAVTVAKWIRTLPERQKQDDPQK